MIISILKSYFILLLSIGFGSVFIFMLGLYLIFRKPHSDKKAVTEIEADHYHHISAIAGDDIITTQLDLARAYIETGRKQLASEILDYVMQRGNPGQQQEAQQLKNYN